MKWKTSREHLVVHSRQGFLPFPSSHLLSHLKYTSLSYSKTTDKDRVSDKDKQPMTQVTLTVVQISLCLWLLFNEGLYTVCMRCTWSSFLLLLSACSLKRHDRDSALKLFVLPLIEVHSSLFHWLIDMSASIHIFACSFPPCLSLSLTRRVCVWNFMFVTRERTIKKRNLLLSHSLTSLRMKSVSSSLFVAGIRIDFTQILVSSFSLILCQRR